MNPIAWHLILRLEDDRVIAPGTAERRMLARTVLDLGRPHRILLFQAADTHLHIAIVCTRDRAGSFARNVENALRWRLAIPVPFCPARFVAVQDQWHLDRLVEYILGNCAKHGALSDRYHDAGNLLDLLGLRIIGAHTRSLVRELLPRVTRIRLLQLLGVPDLHPGAEPEFLAESAAAAVATSSLGSRSPLCLAARVAALQVGAELGLSASAVARHLGAKTRTMRSIGKIAARAPLVQAIRLQMGFRQALAPVPDALSACET